MNLSNPTNGVLGDSQAQGTILDDDGPALIISDATVTEGNQLDFTLSLINPSNGQLLASAQQVNVTYQTANGTAVAGSDYTAITNGSISFTPGQTQKHVFVTTTQDTLDENNETLLLNILTASWVVLQDGQGQGTITDNDGLPVVSIANSSSYERTGAFPVTLSAASGRDVTVNYSITAGTATSGNDYTAGSASGAVTILAGQTSANVPVSLINDGVVESNETFTITLSSPTNATLGTSSATATILNDDSSLTITAPDNTAAETGGNTGKFTITRGGSTAFDVLANLSISGTATNGTDYVGIPPSVTIPAGLSSVDLFVTPKDDEVFENTETVIMSLASGQEYEIGSPNSATVNLTDDDQWAVKIEPTVSETTEGSGSPGQFTITRYKGTDTSSALVVSFTVASQGTATLTTDYSLSQSTQVTIPAGQLSATIDVTPVNDSTDEADETVTLRLSTSANYVLGEPQLATVIIHDNDAPSPPSTPLVWIVASDPNASEIGPDGGQFTVYRRGSSLPAMDVAYTIDTGITSAATSDADYSPLSLSVHFDADQTSATISFSAYPDQISEGDEYVKVDLSAYGGSGPTYDLWTAYNSATATIVDGPVAPSVAVALAVTNAYAAESDGSAFQPQDLGTVTLSRGEGNTSGNLAVYFRIIPNASDDTIAQASDYVTTAVPAPEIGTDVFKAFIPAGKSSVQVSFTPVNDSTNEWDEKINFELLTTHPTTMASLGYTAVSGATTGTITILDNDAVSGLLNRNVDADSTWLAPTFLSNGTLGVDIFQGQVVFGVSPASAAGPTYRGDDNLHPILPVEWSMPGGAQPSAVQATVTFAGFTSTVSFDPTDANAQGGSMRFSLPTSGSIADQLPTGHYDYDIQFQLTVGGATKFRTIRGTTEIVNTVSATVGERELGKHWRLDELDRFKLDDGNSARLVGQGLAAIGGAALVRGDNTSGFFASAPQTYQVSDSPTFTSPTSWNSGTLAGGRGGNYQVTTTTDKATWTFSGLQPNRQYQVLATWVESQSRAAAAAYKVNARPFGSAASFKTVTVDQRYTPGELAVDGSQWRSLGFYSSSSGTLTVELTGSSGETVADAVMLVEDWSYTTPVGSFTTLEHGPLTNPISGYNPQLGTFTLLGKFGDRYEFDYQGLLQKYVDRNANQALYAYTDADSDQLADEISTITRQGGFVTTFAYASGKLDSITDFSGRVTDYQVDSQSRLTKIVLPNPGTPGATAPDVDMVYSGIGDQLSSITDDNGHVTALAYNSSSFRVSQVTNADSTVWSLTPFVVDGFAASGGQGVIRKPATGLIGNQEPGGGSTFVEARAKYTDPRSSALQSGQQYYWFYQTDAYGLTTALAKPATADQTQDVWKWQRLASGLVSSTTEPAGGGGDTALTALVTSFQYDTRGNVTQIDYADQTSESWQYSPSISIPTQHTDELNRVTNFVLDSRGNIEYVNEMEGGNTARSLKMTYTAAPASFSSLPGGLVDHVTVAYGSSDAVTSDTDYFTSGAKIGLVSKVTFALGMAEQADVEFDYDARRNLSQSKDELDRATTYSYDQLDRLITATYANPGTGQHSAPVISYEYDGVGNLRKTIDPRGITSEMQYDEMNRLEFLVLPPNGGSTASNQQAQTAQYVYDELGNITSVIDSLGRTTTHVYNQRNERTQATYPDPNVAAPPGFSGQMHGAPIVYFKYDVLGNLKSVSDPRDSNRLTTYRYDELSRRDRVTLPATSDHGATNYETVFDALGRVQEEKYPGPDSTQLSTTYTYDRFDRVVQQTPAADANGNRAITLFTYDLRDNVTSVTDAKGQSETVSYDRRNRAVDVFSTDPQNGNGKVQTHYTYDAASQLDLSFVQEAGNTASRITTDYSYDNLGRVVSVMGTDPDGTGSNVALVTSYVYDASNNVLSSTVTGDPGHTQLTTYDYDNYNRAWRIQGTAVAAIRPEAILLFDRAGQNTEVREKVSVIGGVASWRSTNIVYDNLGRVYETIAPPDADGVRPTEYNVYDAAGNLRFVRDPLGRFVELTYDELSRLKQTILPATAAQPGQKPTTTYSYNPAGLVASMTDPINRVTSYDFDNAGNLTQVELPTINSVTPTLNYTYDVLGNVTSATDVQGNTSRSVYDPLNRVTHSISPPTSGTPLLNYTVDDGDSGFVTTGTWQTDLTAGVLGDFRHTTDTAATAEYRFSATTGKQYLILASFPENFANASSATFRWFDGTTEEGAKAVDQRFSPSDWVKDGKNWVVVGVTDALTATGVNNLTVKISAGASGRTVADAVQLIELGPAQRTDYDGLSRPSSRTSEIGLTTTYSYDQLGRLIRTTLPNPNTSWQGTPSTIDQGYDSLGNLISYTDAGNQTWKHAYNTRNEKISTTDPRNHTTQVGFDLLGRIVSVIDPNYNVTLFTYDLLDRQLSEQQIVPDSQALTRSYKFDLVGNRTQSIDRLGRATAWTYDERNQLLNER